MVGMDPKEYVSQEFKKSRISRDNADLQAICQVIEESSNLFTLNLRADVLYNIGKGKAGSETTRNYPLNFLEIGIDLSFSFTLFPKNCNKYIKEKKCTYKKYFIITNKQAQS